MILFWIWTSVLVIIALCFAVLPLFRRTSDEGAKKRDKLNKAFYLDRVAEIRQETETGLVADEQPLMTELKQSLLDDVPTDGTVLQRSQPVKRGVVAGLILLVVFASYGLYLTLGNYRQLGHWQQVARQLPELSKKLMQPGGNPLTSQEIQDLSLALRTRLSQTPNDATGWLFLGKIALASEDATTAIGAMVKARLLAPDDQEIMVGYAQAMMMAGDEQQQSQGASLLQSLVDQGSSDIRIYSLLAFHAYEQQDFAKAIHLWQIMQSLLGPEDHRYLMLAKSIASAQDKMKSAQEVSAGAISVGISLSPELRNLPRQGVVIVSVHTQEGRTMPFAAARFPLRSFPMHVRLDSQNVLISGKKLEELTSFIVKVRIDLDGNVTTQTGDFYGQTQMLNRDKTIEVVIDKQY
ncbi:c-type cytochrome biogenesis protein CcmI [Vibrio mangrovi]|uniref:C-type cytochrome biogenesis protein CcmI n=1 Tax=Vibrio mangrovi TaxID=474394 RepID=A0A1Y6IS92_9VIBR|nr:c-type cytochrome biogenesis protein CcmI [Vibrio mangrovi]MDW6001439.1 c-type cytochrome biogenesis protein CcmI [Vibrio mangrovi]SMS00539.1 Cytochrome c-type biogenesis protein CcmH precursor [Vibrio mangrovi]